MPTARALLRRHRRTLLAALIGALAGAAYAHFVGCRTGTCPITSSVWTAALYFGVTGALVGAPGPSRRSVPAERGDPPAPA
ncbi:MAG: DUF6132 family protein [Anaeromyxobacter sp.]